MSGTTYDPHVRTNLFRDAVRYRWATLLAFAILFGALGFLAAQAAGTSYTSTVRIIVNPLAGNPFSPDSLARRSDQLTDVQTEAQLIVTPDVVAKARRTAPDLPPASQLKPKLTITVPPNTQVIDIAYKSKHGSTAQRDVEALANAFLVRRTERATAAAGSDRTSVQQATERAQKALDTATTTRASATSDAQRAALDQEIKLYSAQLAQYAQQLANLETQSLDPGEIVNHAADPAVTRGIAGLPAPVVGLVALLAGAALGLLIVALRERSSDLLRRRDEVSPLGCDVLGQVPLDPTGDVATNQKGGQPTSEPYRFVRTAVFTRTQTPASLAVLGLPGHGHGTQVALGVGSALGRSGFNVLVIGAEPVSPGARQDARGTLSDLLLRDHPDQPAVVVDLGHGLTYLAPGNRLAEASEFFGTGRMSRLLAQLTASFEYVVVGGPPVTTADGQALADVVDATAVVVELGVTTRGQVADVAEPDGSDAWNVIGAVLVRGSRFDRLRGLRRRLRRRRKDVAGEPPAAAAETAHVRALPVLDGELTREEPVDEDAVATSTATVRALSQDERRAAGGSSSR